LGYLPSAAIGARCDFHADYYFIPYYMRQVGPHEVRICTSIHNYKTGPELDDMAFYDLRLVADTNGIPPVPTQRMSWGKIKSEYLK